MTSRVGLWALCALCVLFSPTACHSTAGRPDSTVIVLLGTGNPYPDPNAQGPATAVVLGSRCF
jgi:predicted component of type VI protein secretion system